jgi:ParB family chromosome partitioning protein
LAVVIEAQQEEQLQKFFGRSYGEFSYSNITRTTWVQGMAQMYRLRGPKVRSRTYDNLVIPRLKPGMRILDFGAGQMDYVKHLRKQGHDIRGVEFYFRDKNSIDVAAVHRHIDELCADLRENGLFDVVVCDSVLNSVDSQQAEDDVLACCHAFAKPGALVVWSGRSLEDQRLRQGASNKKRTGKGRTIEFFDADGFTALPRGDLWHFQKMHSFAQVEAQALRYFGEAEIYGNDGARCFERIVRPAWGAVATKTQTLESSEILPALQREFDLPLPDGSTYGRGGDIVSAYRAALERRD